MCGQRHQDVHHNLYIETMIINWSAINNRSVSGRTLRSLLRALHKGMVMRIRLGPAKDMKWTIGSGNHGCWLGSYELDKQCTLEHFV